jgi:hypothetical protein
VFYRGVKFAAARRPQPGFGDFSALLYQLTPLLPALPQAAVGQLLLSGKLHQYPIVRSVCAVILAAGKAALSNNQPEDDHVCAPSHRDEWSRGTLMVEGGSD